MRPRMLTFAVRAVAIQHRGWRCAAERAVVAHVAPQAAGFGRATAGIQHRHRGVIGVHPLRRHHVRTERVHQRTHQPRALTNPAGQGGAVQLDTGAGVDLRLAIRCCAPDYDAETTPLP